MKGSTCIVYKVLSTLNNPFITTKTRKKTHIRNVK